MSVRSVEPRQVTVVLCDVVGWTTLAQDNEPEELAEIAQCYRRRCAAIVASHGGIVAQYLGDGVLAYFGYPTAHEDDAERAVRAALEIASSEPHSASTVPVHIGVATGGVVIGTFDDGSPPFASGSALRPGSDISAFGQAPNLAARLQEKALSGRVVISDHTRLLCRGTFDYRDLGRVQLKGFGEPVQAWEVLGESRRPGRFHALRADELTPLVNRRTELQEIRGMWEAAKAGRGSALLVSGEAGVGKSRLVDEVLKQIVGGALRLRYFCSSHLQSSPLAPLIRQLPRVSGFTAEDDDVARLQKLRQFFSTASLDANEVVPLVATLLAIPYEQVYRPLAMSPQRQRRRLFEVFIDLLRSAASTRPVVMVVEDLHWIDPSSDELVGLVVEACAGLPVLVIATSRSEHQPFWRERTHVTELRLATLDRADSLQMIQWLCRDYQVLDQTAAAIAERADGLPLFIEDLTRDILEASELQPPSPRPSGAHDHIPATLRDALMSRLDRLGSAKEIAQIGAVIGREFPYRLLSRVAQRREDVLKEEIHRLVGSGLLEPRRSASVATYAFRHALIRDAAYSSLLKAERKALHARIVEVLTTEFPEIVETQPEMAAHHLQMAGDVGGAVRLWIDAARLSAHRSGFVEAIAQLQGALDLLGTQDESEGRLQLELRVHMVLGGIYTEQRGFSSPECGRAYAHALALCRRLGDARYVFAALAGVGSFEITRGNLSQSHALAEECLAQAARQTSTPPFVMGHVLMGGTLFLNGEFAQSRRHLDEALRLYEEDRTSRTGRRALYVQDQKATALCYLSVTMTIMGHLEAGLRAARDGVDHSRSLGAPHALNSSLCYLAGVHHVRRETPEASRYATESFELAREQGFATWRGVSQVIRGGALAAAGALDEGLAEIVAGLEAHGGMDAMSYQTFMISVHGGGLLAAGRCDQAIRVLDDAIAAGEQRKERFYLAELLRLKGEALAATGRLLDAEHWLHKAIATAQQQAARLFELRSAVSLCKLRRGHEQRIALQGVLAPICRWFEPDLESRDLAEARELLRRE